MRYNKILLVRPQCKLDFPVTLLPTGLGVIAEIMEQRKIHYEVMDMALGYKKRDLLAKISEFRPELIGISMLSFMYKDFYDLIKTVKETHAGIGIAVGGAHVSMLKEKVLEECKKIDFGIVREGEQSFIELCEGADLEEIRGLIFRHNGRIKYTGDRELISNLDDYPFPKYRKFELHKYSPIIPIYSSRGCPYKCIFCAIKDVMGDKFRARSNGHLLAEIKYWHSQGYRSMGFSDDIFNFDRDRIIDLCQLLKKEKITDLQLSVLDARADRLDKNLLKAMWRVGFRVLVLGIESASNRVLRRIKKGETIERMEQTIKDACELGFDVSASFLIGPPGETSFDVENSFKFALKYPLRGAAFFNIVPTPNTELLDWLTNNGFLSKSPEEYLNDTVNTFNKPLFETPELSLKQRKRLIRKGKRVSKKVEKNYWLHKFKMRGILGKLAINMALIKLFLYLSRRSKLMEKSKQLLKSHVLRRLEKAS